MPDLRDTQRHRLAYPFRIGEQKLACGESMVGAMFQVRQRLHSFSLSSIENFRRPFYNQAGHAKQPVFVRKALPFSWVWIMEARMGRMACPKRRSQARADSLPDSS